MEIDPYGIERHDVSRHNNSDPFLLSINQLGDLRILRAYCVAEHRTLAAWEGWEIHLRKAEIHRHAFGFWGWIVGMRARWSTVIPE